MNVQSIRSLYDLLGHGGYWSRVGSLDYTTGVYQEKYVSGVDAVIEYARTYDGKRNCFISRGARNQDGSINRCDCITFDLDPIRPKGEAATHEQHLNAIRAGRKILSVFSGGYLASSGNGVLLVYRSPDNVLSIPDYYKREGMLIKDVQKLVDEFGVKVDETNYSAAIVKLIGTMSTKGTVSLRRRSRWIDYPIQPYRGCVGLLGRLRDIKIEESQVNASVDLRKLESSFNGDRSTADYHLVTYLKQSGVKPEVALQALRANPLGRQTDEKDQARLIAKVYGSEATGGELHTNRELGYFDGLATKQNEEGIKSGLSGLDAEIRRFPKGEVSVVGARSGFGKSSFACTVAEHLRRNGKRVLYFSTEMQSHYIMHKLVSVATDVPTKHLIEKKFTETDTAKINAYRKEFEASPITICDEFQPTIQLVQNKVIESKPDLIIFDHISQVGTHWEYVAQFARGLKEIASKENLPVLMLAELNEPPRNGKGEVAQSNRGDIRGSQEILFLSALFMFISNPYELKGDNAHAEMHIAKNRYGISGTIVPLNVNKLTGKFTDREVDIHAPDLPEL